MPISTKTGDSGTTGLLNGTRVSKDDPIMEALGTIDELSAHLGLLYGLHDGNFDLILEEIQRNLSHLCALVADLSADPSARLPRQGGGAQTCSQEQTMAGELASLESHLETLEKSLPPLTEFILPRGRGRTVHAHIARTVCRRAERRLVALKNPPPFAIAYLNRLSDYLFLLARQEASVL
ncbi:MAG: cob(I)yrinic acid a,c-diamide adenosyltransferase [Candidatus Gracilibacteria bacterium]|jgi:cob(I)alamin adenosyltransferase